MVLQHFACSKFRANFHLFDSCKEKAQNGDEILKCNARMQHVQ